MFKRQEVVKYPRRNRTSPEHKRYLADWNAARREKWKLAAVNVLTNGEGTCRDCGQGDLDVLTFDHIENNGKEHRKDVPTSKFLWWLIKNDYPDGFQVLCANCNLKKEVIRRRKNREYYVY